MTSMPTQSLPTYFSRHTEKLDVDGATRERLLKENLIAIHFPGRAADDGLDPTDNESLDPQDYHRTKRSVIRTLGKLAEHGGYVCAQYHGYNRTRVGKVIPGTQIQLLHGFWSDGKRPAVLKALQLTEVKEIAPSDSAAVLVARPQQGTLLRWHKANGAIEAMVEGRPMPRTLAALSPAQQEILCSEYLRSVDEDMTQLPRLRHLLLPVGRTMKDIDFAGISTNGQRVFAQVTYAGSGDSKKMNRLRQYASGGSLVYFCNCKTVRFDDGVVVYPLQRVFDEFTAMESGREWLTLALPMVS